MSGYSLSGFTWIGRMRRFASLALIVVAAACADSGANQSVAQAPDPASLNDLEIAHAAYVAGNIDIRYAHLALALSNNADVREFAELMLRDHQAVNEAALALLDKLKAQPQDNAFSQSLLAGSDAKIKELAALSGAAFDKAYAANELAYHHTVNQVVSGAFIPNVENAELKALLSQALATFQAHVEHAKHMVAKLGQ
jgi:putative membrane protein